MKRKALLSSIVTIILCISIIAGSTFALFTSEDSVNVAVTAGNVEIAATIEENTLKTWSLEIPQVAGAFANGGTADVNDEGTTLTLDLLTPGDKVEFNVKVENLSNVHTLYRIRAISEAVDGYKDITPALVTTAVIERGGVAEEYVVGGTENASPWGYVLEGDDFADILVTIEFPDAPDNNDYKNAKADITFVVDAVQGNADKIDLVDAFADGGYVSSGKVPVAVDEDGINMEDEDVTLYDIELNQETANQGYLIGMENPEGVLTLDAGTVLNAADGGIGVAAMGGTLVINDGAKIVADSGYCLLVQASYETTIYLNGSDWFVTENGALPIMATTSGGPIYIIIDTQGKTPLTDAEYIKMIGYENTLPAGIYLEVNDRVVQDTTNP